MSRKPKKAKRAGQGGAVPSLSCIEPHAAGVDVGATEIFVAVPQDRDPSPVRSFETFTEDLHRLKDWLQQCHITTVAIAYASHCTSLGRCETFSTRSLFDNLTPLAFLGGSDPGSS